MSRPRPQREPRIAAIVNEAVPGHIRDAVAAAGWRKLIGRDGYGVATCVDLLSLSPRRAIAIVAGADASIVPVPLTLGDGEVRRARPGDGAAQELIAMLEGGSRSLGRFELTAWQHDPVSGERAIDVDQTNESVVVGDAAVVKWSAQADEGPHPAPSIFAELDRVGFTGCPRPWGVLQWRPRPGAACRMLALIVDYVPGSRDGWSWVVEEIRVAAEHDDARGMSAVGERVGALVASFHLALAGTARPATEEESTSWRVGALADLDVALASTSGWTHELLASRADEVRAILGRTPRQRSTVTRVHGDLHVGQVLRSDVGGAPTYLLTDFDGNPIVEPADRARQQPAALDVAGMTQSLRHAGLVVRKHNADIDPDAVHDAVSHARVAFLQAYRRHLGTRAELLEEGLLRPFALRQVCREFTYAATHLPRWSYVPEGALPILLGEDRDGP